MTETALGIRSAKPGDAPRLHELHASAVRALCASYYEPTIVEGWLANRSAQGYLRGIGSNTIFVAELGSRIVGFGEAVPGEVVAVFVDPLFVKRGIGATLLEHAFRRARSGHQGPVRLESTLNAVAFYERFGFTQIKRSVVRRNQVDVPIVVMTRDDG